MRPKIISLKIIIFCLFALFLYDTFSHQAFAVDFELDLELESVGTIEKKGNERLSTLTANLTILFLIIANVTVLARFIFSLITSGENKKRGRQHLPVIHYVFNVLAFVTTLLHAHWASATSPILIASEIAMAAIGIVGIVLLLIDKSEKENIAMLMKSKRVLFSLLFTLIALGHMLVDT